MMNNGPETGSEVLRSIHSRLVSIEDKLDRLIAGPEDEILTTRQVMKRWGCRSYSAFFRMAKRLELKPLTHGKYRLIDVKNAPARRSLGLSHSTK
jgi:hypothetical protein